MLFLFKISWKIKSLKVGFLQLIDVNNNKKHLGIIGSS